MRYLLDTNVVSELAVKHPNQRVLHWLSQHNVEDTYLNVITIGELSKGVERLPASKRREALGSWLQGDLLARFSERVLIIDVDTMLTWGRLTSHLSRVGRILPVMDSLIAALAVQHHCVLVTRNVGDFAGTGVTLINPWNEA